MRVLLILAGIGIAGGCGGDNVNPGVRGECADFAGAGLECERAPIDSIDDLCAKLVGCGVIPLDIEDGGFDWAECMELEGDLDDRNREAVFACVEVQSCDELRSDGSLPLCLQHGNL